MLVEPCQGELLLFFFDFQKDAESCPIKDRIAKFCKSGKEADEW